MRRFVFKNRKTLIFSFLGVIIIGSIYISNIWSQLYHKTSKKVLTFYKTDSRKEMNLRIDVDGDNDDLPLDAVVKHRTSAARQMQEDIRKSTTSAARQMQDDIHKLTLINNAVQNTLKHQITRTKNLVKLSYYFKTGNFAAKLKKENARVSIPKSLTKKVSNAVFTTLGQIKTTHGMFNEKEIANASFQSTTKQNSLESEAMKYSKMTEKKIILHYNAPWWMTFSNSDSFGSCEHNNCEFTTDRDDFGRSDAVIFTGTILPEMPKHRKPGQIWIYENIESPTHTRIPIRRWKNVFNWTSTYRRDSDFVAPYRFVALGGSQKYADISKIPEVFRSKTGYTAWFVSNCHTKSRRTEYVKRLKMFSSVDIYGACGNLVCKGDEKCRTMLTKKYKFYIAFENSFCRDYITEKALVNLRQVVIPVVRGSAHYDLYMPPESYINTQNFTSIRAVAEYMDSIANNETFYIQFQKWHKYYHIDEDHMFHDSRVMCKICKHLNNPDEHKRVYEDIHTWWHGNVNTRFCETAKIPQE